MGAGEALRISFGADSWLSILSCAIMCSDFSLMLEDVYVAGCRGKGARS